MHKIIETVAQKMKLPCWWVEAIAIEYTECREYATRDEIWTFNFDKLSEYDLEEAVRSRHVVVHGTLMHNVSADVWSSRAIERLVSNIPVGLCEQPDDVIAEGLVSDYHFPFIGNPIDVWDPKLSFSSHFQVLDNGQFWQWHIADFVQVKGRHYGKWTSSEVDLEPLDQIREKSALLRNPAIKPGEPGHTDFKVEVEKFYQWLNDLRRPILDALWDIHVRKRRAQSSFPKVTKCIPPQLSRFESFTIRNGEIYTKFFAAPVFFRSCRQHAIEAEKLVSSGDKQGSAAKLDDIYQERANAIILGAACLEAFINDLGFEHFPKLWKNVESLSLTAKWQLYLVLKGKDDLFGPSREPYQSLVQLKKSRDKMMHFKGDYKKVRKMTNGVITHTELDLPRGFVCALPNRLEQLIRELCEATALPIPPWLTPKPNLGWM
ncbi:hypothetical protein C5S32_09630 [ANME-1 cluster archaeon GoMg1]|nr:hypothetical protein [ANME-1 cluster archaeon GoMg1]